MALHVAEIHRETPLGLREYSAEQGLCAAPSIDQRFATGGDGGERLRRQGLGRSELDLIVGAPVKHSVQDPEKEIGRSAAGF